MGLPPQSAREMNVDMIEKMLKDKVSRKTIHEILMGYLSWNIVIKVCQYSIIQRGDNSFYTAFLECICYIYIYIYILYFTFIFCLFVFASDSVHVTVYRLGPVHIMFSSRFCANSFLDLDIQ